MHISQATVGFTKAEFQDSFTVRNASTGFLVSHQEGMNKLLDDVYDILVTDIKPPAEFNVLKSIGTNVYILSKQELDF